MFKHTCANLSVQLKNQNPNQNKQKNIKNKKPKPKQNTANFRLLLKSLLTTFPPSPAFFFYLYCLTKASDCSISYRRD